MNKPILDAVQVATDIIHERKDPTTFLKANGLEWLLWLEAMSPTIMVQDPLNTWLEEYRRFMINPSEIDPPNPQPLRDFLKSNPNDIWKRLVAITTELEDRDGLTNKLFDFHALMIQTIATQTAFIDLIPQINHSNFTEVRLKLNAYKHHPILDCYEPPKLENDSYECGISFEDFQEDHLEEAKVTMYFKEKSKNHRYVAYPETGVLLTGKYGTSVMIENFLKPSGAPNMFSAPAFGRSRGIPSHTPPLVAAVWNNFNRYFQWNQKL
jgi:hypothetical protein